ncbi:hypothetical protein LJK88_40110 [Paenibacillus sp. P26]|nr:hypothetical protein LJK88_40110 [Paenibacillus sp. P26]
MRLGCHAAERARNESAGTGGRSDKRGTGTEQTQQTNTAQGAQGAQGSSQTESGQTAKDQGQGQAKTAMNESERKMMMTFQTLIRMDKTDGLAITKDQAAAMLPVVQDGITKKELTTDAEAKLTEKLTADQKKFVEDAASRMQNRANGGGGQTQLTDEQKAKMEEARKRRAANGQNANGQNANGGANANGTADGAGSGGTGGTGGGNAGGNGNHANGNGNGGGPRGGGMQNAGQRLVELLQSKTK